MTRWQTHMGAAVLVLVAAGCDDGGSSADSGTTDSGGTDSGTADSGGDASNTTGMDGGSCPTVAPAPASTGAAPQRIAITSVSLTNDTITLRNLSSEAIPLTDWQLCFGPDDPYYALGMATAPFAAGADLTLHLGASGTNDDTNLYLPTAELPDADELGIYSSMAYADPEAVEAYVRYQKGATGGSNTREVTATTHDPPLWTSNDVIMLGDTHGGFVATGSTVTASGFTPASDDCL